MTSTASAGFPIPHGGRVCDIRPTEADYQRYWEDLSFPKEFTTLAGSKITVLEGGICNKNAGPDFLNAIILTEQDVIRGAVEIHLRQDGWWMHGHQSDQRYREVVLHVVGTRSDSTKPSRLKHYPAHTILLTGVSNHPPVTPGSRRCRQVHPVSRADYLLQEAGWKRIRQKAGRFGRLREECPPHTLWYKKILRCLGYGQNHRQMEQLSDMVPFSLAREIAAHLSAEHLFEFLLGLLGYDEYYECRAPVWERMASDFDLRGFRYYDWHPLLSRPMNHPLFRLYLFFAGFETWYALSREGHRSFTAREFLNRLQMRKPVPATYADLFHQKTLSIGRSQAVEVIINCLLPLWLTENEEAYPALRSWVQDLPWIPPYQRIVRFIRNTRWRGRYPGRRIHPIRLQGFLYLQKHWCEQGRCHACPMIPSLPEGEPSKTGTEGRNFSSEGI